jgi:DNA-binding LacI/PurR family transcriptional regulator
MANESRIPKYYQMVQALKDFVRDEGLVPGDRIPSLTELMERYEVSKVTAVRALTELENEGVVRREHGRGTFVAAPRQADSAQPAARTTVHVVVPGMTNPYYAALVDSLARELSAGGIAVEISTTGYRPDRQAEVMKRLVEDRRLFAIVIASVGGPADRKPLESAVPVVFVDYCPPELLGSCSLVCSDSLRGGTEAARYLASLGHQRIGYIDILQTSTERLLGFEHELKARGLPDNLVLTVKQGHSFDHDLTHFVQHNRLTAIFAVNDVTAMKAMRVLRRHGLRVPQDISVMGYDNIEGSAYLDVPLTTMEQPSREIGRRTAELLLEHKGRGAGPPPRSREIVYMPHLVVRESTAPPHGQSAAPAAPAAPAHETTQTKP